MYKELSYGLLKNYILNVFKAKFQKNPIFKPLFFSHYITLHCNFNCSYCDFAKKENRIKELDTEDTLKLMKIIKKECIGFTSQAESHY
jgi:MoaA/NifB/PqqE/SkfB family radical SAM enzyme